MVASAVNGSRVLAANNVLDDLSEEGDAPIIATRPKIFRVVLVGLSAVLFHAWNVEAIEEKSKAAKGSDIKKTDAIESWAL